MRSHDAIVVGAGVNGLTCAGYLARAGLSVLVLEARDRIGGMAELALNVGRLSPVVARELGLRGHGLRLVQPDVRVFAPQPDGRAMTLWSDPARTARELADNPLVSSRDAAAYVDADARLRALCSRLARLLLRPPRASNPLASLTAMRELPMSVGDLVAEWFESDALRAVVAARGILYTSLAPRAPGSAQVLLTDSAGSAAGFGGQAVIARGGPQALIDAMAGAARESGAEIRTAARVARVRRASDRTVGVALDDGEEIDASLVVSSLDPKTTMLGLLDPEVLGPRLSWRASNIRQQGVTARVDFVLGGMPVFPGAIDEQERLDGRILIAPSMRYLELAARPARYGETAEQPLIEATIAREGSKLVLGAVVQAVAPAADADQVGDLAERTLEAYAPGFASLVEQRRVFTPLDIEREYGARGGHPMHAEPALDQWLTWRPLHGLGRYRMPLDGLYLCGAGAHPGGGVTGLPGRLCAQAVALDLKQGSLRLSA